MIGSGLPPPFALREQGQDGYWVIDAPQAPLQMRPGAMRRNGSVQSNMSTTPKKPPSENSVAGGTQHSTASSGGTGHGGMGFGPAAAAAGQGPIQTTTVPKSALVPSASNVEMNLNAYYDEKSCHGPTNVIDLKVYLKAEAIQHATREQRDSRRESQRSRNSQKGVPGSAALSLRVRAEVDDLLSKLGLTETEAAVLRAQRLQTAHQQAQEASQSHSKSLHVEDAHKPPQGPPEDEAELESPQRRRISFVGRLRDPNTGALSNLRLFGGKLGASTAMTRSIGDREAARCCISEPEVVTMVVEASQKARVVICSDGVWDVYDNAEALSVSKGGRINACKTSLVRTVPPSRECVPVRVPMLIVWACRARPAPRRGAREKRTANAASVFSVLCAGLGGSARSARAGGPRL